MYHVIGLLFIITFFSCYFLLPFFEKFAKDKKFITSPAPQKIDFRSIPYLGGIAMFSVFLILGCVFAQFSCFSLNLFHFYMFMLAAAIIVLFGFYDDIREMNPREKLMGQFLGALILIAFVMRTEIIYLNPFFNIILSFFWIILLVNAFNLLDILDGLAGGVSLITTFVFFVFSVLTNNHFVLLISTIQCAVLIAFLRYNLPPARIFMGDAGSQFLGFSQAVMAISLSFAQTGSEIGLVIPLVILALPLFDMLFVIFVRLRQGKSIFLKSNDHFVFRLIKVNFSKKSILRIMLVLAIITNCCALLIFLVSNIMGLFVFILVISIMCLVGVKLSRLEISE
ncbi:MAG: undecaprenyl/decaprenyl-phosphate alpha-N-acetylglucosaminyl 1-phosphate transferase [Candidatus Omnitrophica bacterium]|nr:undecaprenyl/decaprenyl-phosphate alpha-N-acetylglucosaminyl 1-phosphate transferase [Candidatus Omnitrophota bacterium]